MQSLYDPSPSSVTHHCHILSKNKLDSPRPMETPRSFTLGFWGGYVS